MWEAGRKQHNWLLSGLDVSWVLRSDRAKATNYVMNAKGADSCGKSSVTIIRFTSIRCTHLTVSTINRSHEIMTPLLLQASKPHKRRLTLRRSQRTVQLLTCHKLYANSSSTLLVVPRSNASGHCRRLTIVQDLDIHVIPHSQNLEF